MRSAKVLIWFFAACGVMQAQQYIVSTIAGTSQSPGWSGDGGPALTAQFTNPVRIAVDKNLNLYITDYSNQSIRFVNYNTGVVTTIAGNGSLGFSGDGGQGLGAQLADPHDVVVDPVGNVYIADTLNARIRKINTFGNISTFAGTGKFGYSGDGGPALNAQFTYPTGLALDKAGNLYVADSGSATVRKIDTNGNISTVAGTGITSFAAALGDGGPATKATLQTPYSVQVDASGNLYIGDVGTSSIRRVVNGVISTYLTSFPGQNFAIDAAGAIYFANYRNNTVEKVLPGGTRLVIAGDGIAGDSGDGGRGSQAQFSQPYGVALDASGNVYVADAANAVIRELSPQPFSIGAIANAASVIAFAPPIAGLGDATQPIAPGEIVLIFGSGLGPANLTVATPSAKGFFPTSLAGTSVSFKGTAAPLYYTSSGIVAAIVPYEINGLTAVPVTVTYNGKTTSASTFPVGATAPGLFTADSSGTGQARAYNQDFTLNSATNAASVGSVVILYGTGEGQTSPGGTDGKVNPASGLPPSPLQAVSASINGVPAVVDYVGGVPTSVEGLFQINLEIPTGVPSGTQIPVVVTIGGVSSQTVYIAVAGQ